MALYDDCILFRLAKAYQKVQSRWKARLNSYGLTPMQFLVLEALYEEEGLSVGEIGKRLVLDNATLSGVLDRMAEGGWVRKNTADEDRRLVQIFLTPKAKASRTKLIQEGKEANEEVLIGFRMEERLLLNRMLKDLQK